MKNLEKEDVVVFEDSHIDSLKVAINGEELDVNINPNMDLLIPETNNGGDNMAGAHKNIWDSIEVEMNAEGKPIASGSLVIVNDRYGVKIDNVIAQNKTPNASSEDVSEEESTESNEEEEEKNGEEDCDYSDFDIEDENI